MNNRAGVAAGAPGNTVAYSFFITVSVRPTRERPCPGRERRRPRRLGTMRIYSTPTVGVCAMNNRAGVAAGAPGTVTSSPWYV